MVVSSDLRTPGVYREDVFGTAGAGLRTGVPALLGYAVRGPVNSPQQIALWPQFTDRFGATAPGSYLAAAVRGFFDNGGSVCYVVRLDDTVDVPEALDRALDTLVPVSTVDLICAPDVMRPRPGDTWGPDPALVSRLQAAVLDHCGLAGGRFAILDALPGMDVSGVLAQRADLQTDDGALYYPWIAVAGEPGGWVPPCGHVAGVYARVDAQYGVHRAPANEILQSVVDLATLLTDQQQVLLNPQGVNCLRALPGRGIRIWGARTLSPDAAWSYVNVRRLTLTLGRWLDGTMAAVAFEPSEPGLWARIGRAVSAHLDELFRKGALAGSTPREAFYVRCDAQTNTADVRAAGMVVTEIGLAPAVPGEFVVVRIVQDNGTTSITGASSPG